MAESRHEWLSHSVEVSGLLVTEPVLAVHFPEGPERSDDRSFRRLRAAWERFQVDAADPARRSQWLDALIFDFLEIPRDVWRKSDRLPPEASVVHEESDQILRPQAVLIGEGDAIALALWTVAPGQGFDRVEGVPGRWRQTPQVKLETWLRGSSVRFGLLTDGCLFRLVQNPPGLPAAYAQFDLADGFEEKALLDGFRTLLHAGRWFGPAKTRLIALARESEERQTELTDNLGRQVRQAVESLIIALDRQDRAHGRDILRDIPEDALYRTVVFAVMRMVFLLFAEERSLLPHGTIFFDKGYGIGNLLHELERERRERPDHFQRTGDAWPRLLALFRLVFHGSDHPDLVLPAYGGDLFDPAGAMRILEDPRVALSNEEVWKILHFLTFGKAKLGRHTVTQRYSYRTLDVEHIGYVYEGLLDHKAARAGGEPMVKLRGGGEAAYPLPEMEKRRGSALVEWVSDTGGLKWDDEKIEGSLAAPDPSDVAALARYDEATARRCGPYASLIQTDEVVEPESFYLTVSASRRATGTHYTPIQYTRAMVAETLDPLLYVGEHGKLEEPRRLRAPREILALKVCDPAMGSGAFLVQVVRHIGEKLVESWWAEREKHPAGTRLFLPFAAPSSDAPEKIPLPEEREEALEWARRLVAERCVYGVDVNAIAVEMAKLSLWLVSLARDKPFSFLDHALKCGDSLVGIGSLDQLRRWNLAEGGESLPIIGEILGRHVDDALALRKDLARLCTLRPGDVAEKHRLHEKAEAETEHLRALADLLVAADFGGAKPAERERLRKRYEQHLAADRRSVDVLRAEAARNLGGRPCFHWPLEFPEVFQRENGGFDGIVGNPPFMQGKFITTNFGDAFRAFLVSFIAMGKKGSADLVTYFFIRSFFLLRSGGNFGLLATHTIADGDTRQVGLEQILSWGGAIYSAHPDEPWPNDAAVDTSRVHVHKGRWRGEVHRLGRKVPVLSAFLSDREEWSPKQLASNAGKFFQGSIVLGMGFTMSEEEARALIERDSRNAEVLFPYVIGDDLNTHPEQRPSRWVINFWDWPEDVASTYSLPFTILHEKVKPERQRLDENSEFVLRKPLPDRWWHYADKRPALYHSIGRGHAFHKHPNYWNPNVISKRTLACSLVCKYLGFTWKEINIVFSHKTSIASTDKGGDFSLISSSFYEVWVRKTSSRRGSATLNYSPSDSFETFPFPPNWKWNETGPLDEIGEKYHNLRARIMKEEWIGLTKLYNHFHDPEETDPRIAALRAMQVEIDRKVAGLYGWSDLDLGHDFHEVGYLPENDRVRFTVSEPARREILKRLDALNRERYDEECRQGLHDKKKPSPGNRAAGKGLSPRKPEKEGDAPEAPRQNAFGFYADTPAGGLPLRPPAPAPVAKAAPSPADPASRIAAYLTNQPGWHSRADIVDALGLPVAEWNAAARILLDEGKIERKGEKRGTRYRIAL